MAGDRGVWVFEVAPRDGLQIEPGFVATADKIAWIDRLSEVGFGKIEVSSFVSPKAVPALADAADVFAGIRRAPATRYVALVPNLRGATAAVAAAADEINFVLSVSETHNRANMGMTPEASLAAFQTVVDALAEAPVRVHATVATAFGCPFEGVQSASKVRALAQRLLALGAQSLTFADTTGMANPAQVSALAKDLVADVGDLPVTFHFHDTRGMGLANILAAFERGIVRFDAALGGLGGCPFAPGATGNVCSEDVAHMFEMMGVDTGIDLPALLEISRTLPALVGHETPGRVAKAGPSTRRYPPPL